MNLDCWEGLSDEQQDAINRGMDKFKVFGMDAIDGHLEEYLQTLKDANCTAYELTDEENAAFIDLTMPLLDQAAEIAGADGAALLEAFATLRNS
jgi:TRAP-type C4-dicarboxylate transport system substrate-binding protein